MIKYTLPQSSLDSYLKPNRLSFEGRYGLPNSVREALLQRKQGEVALVIDALLLCGIRAGKALTFRRAVDALVEHGVAMSKALVRRALNSGIFQMEAAQTGHAGRPEKIYQMPDVAALVQRYAGGHLSAADDLKAGDMGNLRLYRQALHREFIRRAPGIYSRAFLGRRLGVGKRTTRNYDLRVGVRAVRRLIQENLLWVNDWPSKIRLGKVGLNWLRVCFTDGRFFDAPLLEGVVRRHLWKMGVAAVYFITQGCNRYFYSPDADWADTSFLYAHDDERCFAHSDDPLHLRDQRLAVDPVSVTLSIDRKAYQAASDPIPAWLPPEMAARRVVTNPFAR